jgi:hypothetical protein
MNETASWDPPQSSSAFVGVVPYASQKPLVATPPYVTPQAEGAVLGRGLEDADGVKVHTWRKGDDEVVAASRERNAIARLEHYGNFSYHGKSVVRRPPPNVGLEGTASGASLVLDGTAVSVDEYAAYANRRAEHEKFTTEAQRAARQERERYFKQQEETRNKYRHGADDESGKKE